MNIPISELWAQNDASPETMQALKASRLRKAGLYGNYATADSPQGHEVYSLTENGRGAYLWGEPGRGKTYAAATAVRLALESGKKAKLLSSTHLLDAIKAGFDGIPTDALEHAERYELLALDDLGVEKPTAWAIEQLTRLIDTRTISNRPTIITSNYSIGQLRERWGGIEGARIASRIAGACEAMEVTGKDRRLT